MSDIVKDAAIIFLAERARKLMSVDTFITRYPKDEWDHIKELLSEYYLTSYTYSKGIFDLDGEYILVWSEEQD